MLRNILDDLDDTIFVCQSQNEPKKRVRKLKEKWTSEQIASLIQEVEAREGTWNFLSREYRDRNLREALWQEVADVLKMSRSEVATKWNSLRCSFRAMFNKMGQTKSGQAAGKTTPTNPLYNSLKFLEPTLQIQAPTTSNFANDSLLTSPGSPHGAEAYSDLDDSQPTARRAAVKRCAVENEDEYSKVVKRALQTMAECTKSDAWSDVGDFVASNVRLWATEKPQLANNFKTDIYELVLNYQKKATRVYVGSISFELKEDTIRGAFLPFGPIKSINMSWDPITQKHKGFAFVEYEIPEGAQLALEQMNGALMGGRNIKVGRPSNMPQAQQVIDEIQEEAKNFNRIYVASIHPDLSEDDIKSVFEAFGPILYCKLAQVTSSIHTHKGYGFIEYANKQAMDEAIASMNLFDLGGQLLRVGRSITPPNALVSPATNSIMPTAAAVAAAAATAKIQALDAVASNAVLGLTSTAPVLGISPLSAKVANLPLPTPGNNTLSSSSAGPYLSASMFQTPNIASNVITASALQAVSSINTSVKSIIAPTSNVTIPIIGKLGGTVADINPSTTISAPIVPLAALNASTLPNLITPESGKANRPQGYHQEELQKVMIDEGETQTLQQQENMSIKGQSARQFVMQRLMRPQESRVIILRNMVGPEDVDETLQEEIQEECTKFGHVSRVIIFNEKQTEREDDDEAEVIVKIFVEFSTTTEAKSGKDALHGRFFGGRRVTAELYDQSLFDHGDLSG